MNRNLFERVCARTLRAKAAKTAKNDPLRSLRSLRESVVAGACVRVFVCSCVLSIGGAAVTLARQASTPPSVKRTDTGEKVAILNWAAADAVSPQGYSVVLVLGDMQTAAATDGNVPAAARKALTDMKDFLPYKSYRLLDAQWILGSQRTNTRLRGPNDQDYELSLRGEMFSGKLRVAFRLQEPGAGELSAVRAGEKAAEDARARDLQKARAITEAELNEMKMRGLNDKQPNMVQATERLLGIKREIEAMKAVGVSGTSAVIDTSFTMDVGETVVVGTSRVRGGDKALIALLTAVPKAKAPAKN